MTEENKEEEKKEKGETPAADATEGEATPKKSKKKLFIMIGSVVLVIVIALGAFFALSGKKSEGEQQETEESAQDGHKADGENKEAEEAVVEKELYVDLDDFLVNLNSTSKTPSFLKMSVSLQINNQKTADVIKEKMPVIRDAFQVYLRELTTEELKGSAGIYRLREELLLRINKVLAPEKVQDILFKEILVQ